ncbi:MAG: hypothetical protein ACJA17_001300 [Polaribacter sp.]|jgi:hypothetical protein
MNYFTQFWNENRDDKYADWGTSTWYFETDDTDEILKQITIYKSEKVLKYSEDNLIDEFGVLDDQKLTQEECDGKSISKEAFYALW